MFRGEADVVVCDGFVGNVLLKASEGVAGYLQAEMRDAIEASRLLRWVSPWVRRSLSAMRQRNDPSRHNGASLLGLRGVVIKSHGGAGEQAMLAAIGRAVKACEADLPARIAQRLQGAR